MSDGQTTEAVLRLVVQGQEQLDQAVKLFRELQHEVGPAGYEQTARSLNKTLGSLGSTIGGLNKQLGATSTVTAQGAQTWSTLETRVKAAAAAYKTLNQAQLAAGKTPLTGGQFLASPANAQGVNNADLAAFQQGANMNLFAAAAERTTQSLPRLRYALYDVANSATFTGLAMTGLSVATAAVAIKMDRQFADVLRTTVDDLSKTGMTADELRGQFEALFSNLPTTWGNLTQIGQLAGQLGIASSNMSEFTKLVVQFSTTTGISVEQSATAFGRLSALLGLNASQYQAMGSSILAVGTSSVATEQEIINTSTQIASMGKVAGLSADQVFGLSATLASLGIQPELSRGLITRLFTNIATSVQNGGQRLQAFAAMSGESAAQFKQSWGTDAAGALQTLLTNIGQMDQSTAISAIQSLGITAARDVPAILKLAQNHDLLSKSLQVAAKGMKDQNELQKQYSVISSTMAEKLQVLANNFQLLVEHVASGSTALGGFVDVGIGFLRVIDKIVNNPVTATVAAVTLGLTALTGVILLAVGAFTRFAASTLAVRTAMNEMNISSGVSIFSLRTLTSAMVGTETAAAGGSKALGAMAFAVKGMGIATAALIAIPLLDMLKDWAHDADGATVSTEKLAAALGDVISGKNVKSGLKQIDDQIAALGRSTGEGPLGANAGSNQVAGRITVGIKRDLSTAGVALDSGLAALGHKMTFFENPANFGAGVLTDWLNPTISQLKKVSQAYADLWHKASTATEQQKVLNAFDQLKAKAEAVAVKGGQSASDFEAGWRQNMAGAIQAMRGGVDAEQLLAEKSQQAADDIKTTLSSFTDPQNALIDTQNSIYSLGQALGEGGTAWSVYSEAGRANMGALMQVISAVASQTPDDAMATASNLQSLFNVIVTGGFASAQQLSFLQDTINGLANGQAVTPAINNFSALFFGLQAGQQKNADAAQKAADKENRALQSTQKEVRTLVDYANDLSGVFTRAFDIRFGSQQGIDKIASQWQDIRKTIDDAKHSIDQLRASQAQLAADKSVKEYWLSVANQYGDTVRAKSLRADISNDNSQMADNSKQIADAQAKMSTSLTGNSEAAIKNRGTILDLVKSYEDLITQYASSGLTQDQLRVKVDQLKQRFIQQATQLGFSRTEVMKYTSAFDDMRVAIGRVPRNITVRANTNPALQALAEFQAKLKAATKPVTVPVKIATDDSGIAKSGRANAIYAQIASLRAKMLPGPLSSDSQVSRNTDLQQQIQALSRRLTSGNYYTGGFTGPGGMYDYAGSVHKGEFVFNKQATDFYGPSFLNKQMQAGMAGGASGSSGGSNGIVEISRASAYLIADLIARRMPEMSITADAVGAAARTAAIANNNLGRY